jgi:hypothetical protein
MSLNKIPPLPGGENVGYDLKLNVGADQMKCNNLVTTNINGVPYNPSQNILYLTNQVYATLDIGNYDTFILKRTPTDPTPYTAEIQLIEQGLYDGQEITICVIGDVNISLTIKEAIPESGVYKTIAINGGADISLTTGTPYYFREVKLRYNTNSVAGVNAWHCFQDIQF